MQPDDFIGSMGVDVLAEFLEHLDGGADLGSLVFHIGICRGGD